MKRPFQKPATTYAEQLTQLQARGLVISDMAAAAHHLQHLNYYRLGAYWLPFEADHATHQFRPGVCFEEVINLYIFDRELRLLIIDAIERFEVSARAQWAYQMAHLHGPHSHLDSALARKPHHWQSNLDSLVKEVHRSDEAFITHLTQTYAEALPPVWAVCEVMSLGLLSRWYGNLKSSATRRAISKVYALDESVFESWLHHLTFIRNTCAHHSRLWNRDFTITAELPRSKPAHLAGAFVVGSRKLYNTLTMMLHLMDTIAPAHHWRQRVKALMAQHRVNVSAMGFPPGWGDASIWQEATP
jgi:abortive infection bacteriophage resistance protein